jgi:hypothetical protein
LAWFGFFDAKSGGGPPGAFFSLLLTLLFDTKGQKARQQ